MEVLVPAGSGVDRISGRRIRAEVTDIFVGYYRQDGVPVADRQDSWQISDAQGIADYAFFDKTKFDAVKGADLRVWVDGTWRWGNRPGQSMAKVTLHYFPDHAEVSFYTGADDPYPDTIISIYFEGEVHKESIFQLLHPTDYQLAAQARRPREEDNPD